MVKSCFDILANWPCVSRARLQSVKVRANNVGRVSISAHFSRMCTQGYMKACSTTVHATMMTINYEKKADCVSRYNDRFMQVINHHPFLPLVCLFDRNKVIRIDGMHNWTCGVFYGLDRLSTTGVIIAIRTLGVSVISAWKRIKASRRIFDISFSRTSKMRRRKKYTREKKGIKVHVARDGDIPSYINTSQCYKTYKCLYPHSVFSTLSFYSSIL